MQKPPVRAEAGGLPTSCEVLSSASHGSAAPNVSPGGPEDRNVTSVKATLVLGQKVGHFSKRFAVRSSLNFNSAIHSGKFHTGFAGAEPGTQFAPRRELSVVYRNVEVVGDVSVDGAG